MTRSRRLVVFLVAYLPVLALVAVSVWHVIREADRLMRHVDRVIEAEMSRRWNREVRIGRVRLTPLGSAVIEDIQVAASRTLAQGKLFSAKRIVVRFDFRSLLEGNGAQSVSEVDVFEPWLMLVRRKDGSLNVFELLKPPPGPPRPPFRGIIRVHDAGGCFKDYRAHIKTLPAINCTRNFDAVFDAAAYPLYTYQVKGLSVPGRLGPTRVVGRYHVRTRAVDLDLDARNASAAYWIPYFGTPRGVSIIAGKLDLLIGINIRRIGKRVESIYTGSTRVSGAALRVPRLRTPIRDIGGTVVLAGSRAAIDLAGIIANSRVRAVGLITDFRRPRVEALLTAPSLDYAALIRSVGLPAMTRRVRVSGRGPARMTVKGLLENPYIRGSLRVPRLQVDGYTAERIAASGSYRDGQLALGALRFSFEGAEVAASGTVDLRGEQSISVQGNTRGVALASLARRVGVRVSGFADAQFAVGGTLSSPVVTASVTVPQGTIEGMPFRSLSSQLEIAGGRVNVAGLVIKDIAGGVLKTSGLVTSQALDLSFTLEGANLERLPRPPGEPGYAGTGYFSGQVTGPLARPTVTGTAEVFKGRFGRYEVDYARAAFAWSAPKLTLQEAVVRLFPAEVRVSGDLTRLQGGRFAFDGKAHIERLRAEHLLAILGRQLDITGIITGDFAITGRYDARAGPIGVVAGGPDAMKRLASALTDTVATGTLRMEDGTAFGVPVEEAVAELELRDNAFRITRVAITSEEAKLTISGTANPFTKETNIAFKLDDLDLTRTRDRISDYVVLGGVARVEGTVAGDWGNPTVKASGGITKPVVNYKPFDDATFELAYSNGVLDRIAGKLVREKQAYSFDVVGYNPQTMCLTSADVKVDQAWVRDIWDMFRGSPFLSTDDGAGWRERIQSIPRITGGIVNGTMQVTGCLERPDGSLKLTATNVGLDAQQIESIDVDITSKAGYVKLDRFLAVSQDLNIQATADPLYHAKKTNVELAIRNMDLSRLRPWLGDNTPGGTLDAEVTIKGDVSSPETVGSIEVISPTFRGLAFDRFRASTLQIKDGRIEIADVILASGPHQVVASGHLPWSWSTFSIPAEQPLELSARLNRQDLSILSVLTPAIDVPKTKGQVEGELRVAGTIVDPQLSGELKVAGGTLAVKGFASELTGVVADVSFGGNRIVVNRAEGTSSKGGKVGIQPGGYVAVGGGTPKLNLLLFAEKLRLAERNFLGLNEDIDLQVDAGISVIGDWSSPVIADASVAGIPGGIAISNAKLSFALPDEIPSRKPQVYAINPSFNISLRVGNNVVLSPPSMSLVVVSRTGSLTGDLGKPNLQLDLEIREGTFRLATARLRAIPGGSINVTYAPPTTDIRVNIQATASVMATNRLGRRERYEVTLTARGSVSDLRVDLQSQPPGLSRPQMLAALGHVEGLFTSAEKGLQQDLAGVLGAVGTTTLFGPIESLFVEKLGFEQFSLDYSAQTPLGLYVQRKLFGNFFVGYYQKLSGDFASAQPYDWRFTFGYRLRRVWTVSTSVDDQQTITVQIGWNSVFN